MSTVVTLRGVSFEFPNGRELFQHLNLSLEPGLSALVGSNGVGKTTLARILSGETLPTKGSLRRTQSLTFFPQMEEPPPISLEDFLAKKYIWSALGQSLLEGIPVQTLCTQLSGGQWMRVRLATTLDEQFLILDEPTNDLDRSGRSAVLRFLKERTGGALVISHDRECLALCKNIFELSNRGLAKFGDGWSQYTEHKQRERDRLTQSLEGAKNERKRAALDRTELQARQEKRNRKGAATAERGGMPKILLGARKRQAQATTGKVDTATYEKANRAVEQAHQALQELKLEPVMYADLLGHELPSQQLVAEAVNYNVRFSDWLYTEDLNFCWRGNVRLALKGDNGSGKSTLLKAILGQPFEARGSLRVGNLSTVSVDQSCASLNSNKSIFENIREATSLSESEIRNGLARFLFSKESVFQRFGDLSGGERLRAVLAQGFLKQEKPELLILDEATNNLDLVNIQFLENLVRSFRGALIVISHDEEFLSNCGITQEVNF